MKGVAVAAFVVRRPWIACLPELAPHLPKLYAETCALLARGANGRIVMPPPDVAPSCS